MPPATREIVERLAKEAGAGSDMWLIGIDEIERFWSLAMEYAAGICDEQDVTDNAKVTG